MMIGGELEHKFSSWQMVQFGRILESRDVSQENNVNQRSRVIFLYICLVVYLLR